MSDDAASSRKVLSRLDIEGLPQRHRTQLINSISGFKSANLVGTADAAGRPACCIVSSAVHIGSNPALLGVVFRPPGDEAHNYRNLSASGSFTLSHVSAAIYSAAHQTSARYPEGVSEFDEVGLTAYWHGEGDARFPAPAVEESPVRIGLTVEQDLPLPNGCHFVIGAVQWVDFNASSQVKDGFLDLSSLGTVCIGGLDAYHRVVPLARFSYAKPDRPLEVRKDFMQGWDK
jgi:flavin reductase (DIM6/NTAB) family NADH-FMN oxidoreductase RutF